MNFGFSLLAAHTHTKTTHTYTQSSLPALLSWPGPSFQVGCFGAAQWPRMTLAMGAVQLGYSTESEALSDTTMRAARHNTDALTGGTAGMLLLCLLATGMEGWRGRMNGRTDGKTGAHSNGTRTKRGQDAIWSNQNTPKDKDEHINHRTSLTNSPQKATLHPNHHGFFLRQRFNNQTISMCRNVVAQFRTVKMHNA